MATLNISLPDVMRAFVDGQVAAGGYSTASEYVRELVRADQKRAAKERLDQLLIEGIESGLGIEISEPNCGAPVELGVCGVAVQAVPTRTIAASAVTAYVGGPCIG